MGLSSGSRKVQVRGAAEPVVLVGDSSSLWKELCSDVSICLCVRTLGISRPSQCLEGSCEWLETQFKSQAHRTPSSKSLVLSFFLKICLFIIVRDRVNVCVHMPVCAFACVCIYS